MTPEQLLDCGVFDARWYASAQGLDPDLPNADQRAAEHFLRWGLSKGFDPSPRIDLRFHADLFGFGKDLSPARFVGHLAALSKYENLGPDETSRLPWALDRLERRGKAWLALDLAERLLPAEMKGFRDILTANRAVGAGDGVEWLVSLNRYLDRWGVKPIRRGNTFPGPLGQVQGPDTTPVSQGPLVTVIVSAWQSQETLEASVNSILSQGWQRLEVIALDDASTDKTARILHRIALQDDRLRVLSNPVNVGPYVGRNLALGLARGDWICCLDADEWAHPDLLSDLMHAASQPKATPVIQNGMLRMAKDGRFTQIGRAGSHTVDGALRRCPSSTLFNTDFLRKKLGGWEPVRLGADSEMIARATALTGRPPEFVPKPLVLSLDHPDSLTNRDDTGTGRGGGLSPARARYRQVWQDRLSAMHRGAPPSALVQPFPALMRSDLPPEVTVPLSAIWTCIQAHWGAETSGEGGSLD